MKKGFTLIELLVVVAIIGVLASMVLSSLSTARARIRDTKRLAEIRSIQKALELYYLDHGEYPQGFGGSSANFASTCLDAASSNSIQWGNFTTLIQPYVGEIQLDGIWPICTYYLTGSYFSCDGVSNPKYTLIFSTEVSNFSGLDLYNSQGENGSKARYCLYPPQ